MNIAVYWDFENIHASLGTVKYGQSWYKENRLKKQPYLIDINIIMDFVSALGNININKAYANWSNLFNYNFDLQNHAIDLIQLFPRGSHGKNGADIRMAIEVIEDIALNSHITTVVIIGGDSDYISIAQKVRQKGRSIIGIGVKETTNQYWVKSCNEFKFYSSLLISSSKVSDLESEGYEVSDINEAKVLIIKAIKNLSSSSDEKHVKQSEVKPMIVKIDPSFDEKNYGFKTFGELLIALDSTIEIFTRDRIKFLSIKDKIEEGHVVENDDLTHNYNYILKKQQIRLVHPTILNQGVIEAWDILTQEDIVESYVSFKQILKKRLIQKGFNVDDVDVTKVKQILYKSFAFKLDYERKALTINPNFTSATNLLAHVHYLIIKRILDNIDEEPNIEELGHILHGNVKKLDKVELLVKRYRIAEQRHSL